MKFRFVNCEACQGEGRIWLARGNDPIEHDAGECEECFGECVIAVPVEPIDMEDLP